MTARQPSPGVAGLARELSERGASDRPLALVLGSGLGAIADELGRRLVIPGEELEHLPRARVAGHAGSFVLGELSGVPVIAQVGRLHLYEGWDAFTVTRAVRAFARLGVRALVLTNAAGGIVPDWTPGTLMLVRDHLNLQGRSPFTRDEAALANPYDPALGKLLEQAAGRLGLRLEQGIYAGLLGPSYETPAEIRMLQALGAQAVGMSTVAEASAARAAGLRVAALSCIANPAAGLAPVPLRHEDVLAAVGAAARDVQRLLADAAPALVRATT